MKRAVVTGATGFVGACLARRLLRDGHEVHLLVRPGHQRWRIAELDGVARLRVVDTGDRAAVLRAVDDIGPDWVFNLMAHGAYSSQTDAAEIVATNLLGTMHLLDAARSVGTQAFVQAGTSSEYGFQDHAPKEHEALAPNSVYAVAKAAATHYCQMIARQHELHVVTLRLYSVYGPHEEPTRLVPTLIRHGLAGRLPPLVAPETARDFVYVDDVEEAFVRAASIEGQPRGAVYNIGTGRQTTLREAVDALRRVLPISVEPTWGTMNARSWDTSVWVADNTAARQHLGFSPRWSFEDGLRATVAWITSDNSRRRYYEDRIPLTGG